MLKRLTDIVLAVAALFLLSPLLLITAILVKKNLGSPVLFRQIRPGLGGQPFEMVKFRTMRDAYDVDGNQLPDEERLTVFGRLLRSTSIDELPELWNVIKGEMSLVGPRPLLMQYLPLYTRMQLRRHEVRPGITGWAQVNGRNTISWEKKFEFDIWYVDHQSMILDCKIMLLTLKKVFFREGINETEEVIVTRFKGTKEKEENSQCDGDQLSSRLKEDEK